MASAYSFGHDRQYAFFQPPFQAYEWANAEVLFVDIDYSHFKYLFNVVCLNGVTKKYMACGRMSRNNSLCIPHNVCFPYLIRKIGNLVIIKYSIDH